MTQVVPNNVNGAYTFSSQPRALQQRKKYKESQQQQQQQQIQQQQWNGPNDDSVRFGNIMYDRRVIRGNTYALHTLPATAQPDPIEIQKEQEMRRRALARKRAKDQLKPHTPEPVDGRKHTLVQTELYLEELNDRVEEADVDVQTDAFLDRPPSPLFIPAKTGMDQATQILDGDLFDFDIEVKPILEVLVGKTVEQSLLEVMEEEELANLRKQQREFEEMRNAEKVEQQRLEEQERRLREEKQRRMQQANEVLRLEKETAEKLAAKAFAKSYLSDLVPSVFNNLKENGYFFDPVERDIEHGFLPWLMGQALDDVENVLVGRNLLDEIIRHVVVNRDDAYEKMEQYLLEQGQKQEENMLESKVVGTDDVKSSEDDQVAASTDLQNQADDGKDDANDDAKNDDDAPAATD